MVRIGLHAREPSSATAKLFGGYHLRHFVGTFLANRAGANLAAASFVLGHKDLGTTSIYVHADEDAARALLKSTDRERSKATREAAAWAKKKVREIARKAKGPKDSDKILSRISSAPIHYRRWFGRFFRPPSSRGGGIRTPDP